MRVTLFGTRGSVPAPGPDTARYGGNTPSVEVRGADGTVLVLDAGTGIRRLGAQLPPDLARIDILLTHLHMDHIQGLGFFAPALSSGHSRSTSGGRRAARCRSMPASRATCRRPCSRSTCATCPASPVTRCRAPAFEIGPFRIRTALVCHPNPTVGYRIEEQGRSARLPARPRARARPPGRPVARAGMDLGLRPRGRRRPVDPRRPVHRRGVRRAASAGATAPIVTPWSSRRRVGAKEVVLFHHDPGHDDATLERLLGDAVRRFKPAFRVSGGREGAVYELGPAHG